MFCIGKGSGLSFLFHAGFVRCSMLQMIQRAWQAHVQRSLADTGKTPQPACAAKSAGVLLSPQLALSLACVGLSSWLAHGHSPFDAIKPAHAFVGGRVETMT